MADKKDKNKVTGPAPKDRNPVVREMLQKNWNAGGHHNRGRDVETGRSRKPKHRNRDLEASASSVVEMFRSGSVK